MIAKLTGKVDEIGIGYIVLDVNGVGYLVSVTNNTLQKSKQDNKISLFSYLAVRENALNLYGFLEKEELDFFELLITISGIGPKSALGILNAAPIETIKEGVASGDSSHLTRVSGIGKKNAEKIIVELRDKIGSVADGGSGMAESSMAIEALTSLGYSLEDSRQAIQKVDKSLDTGEMVKQALKQLGS